MENASKALIIAGSMLISIIILSLLVMFFNNLSSMVETQEKSETVMQAAEFNKQFTSFERAVYGSEILSLANKVADYNKRESDENGYTEVKLTVDLTGNNIDINGNYFKSKVYEITERKGDPLNADVSAIEEEVKKYSSRKESEGMIFYNPSKTWSRTIAQLAEMVENDWLLKLELDTNSSDYTNIKAKIKEYNKCKNLVNTFKQSKFKCNGFEYDKSTGRIKEMKYVYVK